MAASHLLLPPLELLQELFYVSNTSPSGLRWKKPRVNSLKPDAIAGNKTSSSYWRVKIKTDKAKSYLVHRVVFCLQTGVDPGINQVDHVYGLSDPLSLRLATPQQNSSNQVNKSVHASSTYKGVSWNKKHKKWSSNLYFNYKQIYLGSFDVEKEAAEAYDTAAIEFFGEFACVNFKK